MDVSSESNEFTILQCVSQADRRYWRTNKDYWGNSTSTQAGSVETYVRLIAFRDSDQTVLIKGESCLKKTNKLDNDWYIAKSTAFDENTINATFEATKLCALSRLSKKVQVKIDRRTGMFRRGSSGRKEDNLKCEILDQERKF